MEELVKKPNYQEQQEIDETSLNSIHLIADFFEPKYFVEDAQELEKILFEAAYAADNTPIKASIHKFPIQGITGVILLAESHISIHTWPEHNYIAIDVFTCGNQTKPNLALEYLKTKFRPKKVRVREIQRGDA